MKVALMLTEIEAYYLKTRLIEATERPGSDPDSRRVQLLEKVDEVLECFKREREGRGE